MTKMPRDEDGLTVVEAKAAALCAQGLSQSEAYRQATGTTRAKPETVHKRASDMFKRAHVRGRVRELLDAAKPQDILSVGRWMDQLVLDVETARVAGNHNAVMNGTRLLGQALGTLRDTVSLSVEARTDDDTLLEQLADGDSVTRAALQRLLGAKESFDA